MSKTTPLVDFFNQTFHIPHYQRGYRWEEQEVNELLDDLWSFEKTSNKGEFYCLQPIVLKKNKVIGYDVLDGQQRLTTLYLLLVYLDEKIKEDNYNQLLFTLNYETRKNCEPFLNDKKFVNDIDESNIDFYHICKAYQTIDKWFKNEKHRGAKGKLVPLLMDEASKSNRNIRFIRYEVPQATNPIEVFIRLNIGKIPLTDAELIKALLLQSDKYNSEELKFTRMRLFEIATEWDNIEYTLQNEEFWYFLSNSNNQKPTYIELIFDLIADKIQREKRYFVNRPVKHATFLILSEYLQDLLDNEGVPRLKAVEVIWDQVNDYFEYFKEWYNSRTLFHYIGFLIAIRSQNIIDHLIHESSKRGKGKFIAYLESEVGKMLLIDKIRKDSDGNEYKVKLGDLNYENEDQQSHDRQEIHKILLFQNVYSSLLSDKEKARFPFNLYKSIKHKERWSLEHIHAQNSEQISNKVNQHIWLSDHIQSLSRMNNPEFNVLLEKMNELINADQINREAFEAIVAEVDDMMNKLSGASEKNRHSINNLCLVDAITNSKLNNSVFDVKREIIKEIEVEGQYIPLCTRNVFLKAYTSFPVSNAYWTAEDRKSYLDRINDVYEKFINAIIED
ncbi:DUF262 domain-containing protein [Chryseobacterium viscerum]|uniref:DUF262 domain-containing protein n=1 Tax=Chryseobacterium viscerum TaxID=1037377 RepID=A0A5N4BTK6_9FLAO|nr:DUF262 domain-containing protein [Chryseobacterium viscerum]KAB1231415.1 DUF262 domain-containing protein [Chryseobacterium viscerum]